MAALLVHIAVAATGGVLLVCALLTMTCAQLCYGWRGALGYILGSIPFALLGLICGLDGLGFFS